MSSFLERAARDNAVSPAAGTATMRTPEDISAFCDAALHRRMLAAADDVIGRYKQAVKGCSPAQQIALTRAMRRIRNRRSAVPAEDRAGMTAAYWEFTELAIAPLPGVRPTAGVGVSASCGAPRPGA